MITYFRVVDTVSDNAVNFGRLNSPSATPGDSVIMYDYASKHLENISTFPDRSRYIPASYDYRLSGWFLSGIYASDVRITNKFLLRKGIDKEVPLYFKYISSLPMKAISAIYDGVSVSNYETLQYEYQITDRNNTNMMRSYLHNVEFVPYAVHHNVAVDSSNDSLFYLYVYSNGSKDLEVHKIRFKAIDTNDVLLSVLENHYEYLSVSPMFDKFNISYSLKTSIPDASVLTPTNNDPDRNYGRSNGTYSLIYDYTAKAYVGVLADRLRFNTNYMQKPLPWLTIYYNGTTAITSSNVHIERNTNGVLILNLLDVGTNPKIYTFVIDGKSSTQVAADINNSGAPFSAYALLRLTDITDTDLWINSSTRYTDPNATSLPTAQHFDLTQDGGIILRSSYFFSRYTVEPTVYSKPPSAMLNSHAEWYPSVKFGGFVSDDGNAYFVNEYATQGWSTVYGYPYKDIPGENAYMLDTNTIQCKHTPIYNNENHLILTDSSGNNLNYNIDGIDSLRGLVFLKQGVTVVPGVNELFLSYSYEERFVNVPVDINPLPGHTGKIGKYYVVSLDPYVDTNGRTNSSTIVVDVLDSLPTQVFSNGRMVLAAYLIVDNYTVDKYSITQPAYKGGGLNKQIPIDTLNRKVPDLHSFADMGLLDGLRFPANCVLLVSLPSFLKQGTRTVLLDNYSASSLDNNILKVYGASNIPPGTTLRIYSGLVGTGSYEDVVSIAAQDHETIRLATPLTLDYNTGSSIILSQTKAAQFDDRDIESAVSKFMTAGSHNFIDYRDQ